MTDYANAKKVKAAWAMPAYMKNLPDETREGYRIGPFGMHKDKYGWHVSHILTKTTLPICDKPTLKECEAAVRHALSLGIMFDTSNLPDVTASLRKVAAERGVGVADLFTI